MLYEVITIATYSTLAELSITDFLAFDLHMIGTPITKNIYLWPSYQCPSNRQTLLLSTWDISTPLCNFVLHSSIHCAYKFRSLWYFSRMPYFFICRITSYNVCYTKLLRKVQIIRGNSISSLPCNISELLLAVSVIISM